MESNAAKVKLNKLYRPSHAVKIRKLRHSVAESSVDSTDGRRVGFLDMFRG